MKIYLKISVIFFTLLILKLLIIHNIFCFKIMDALMFDKLLFYIYIYIILCINLVINVFNYLLLGNWLIFISIKSSLIFFLKSI